MSTASREDTCLYHSVQYDMRVRTYRAMQFHAVCRPYQSLFEISAAHDRIGISRLTLSRP